MKMCIDVDVWKENVQWTWTKALGVLRALYEYSFMKREVVLTNHGYHIYIETPTYHHFVRWWYGDDEVRWERDYRRLLYTRQKINVCFNNSEKMRVSDDDVTIHIFGPLSLSP